MVTEEESEPVSRPGAADPGQRPAIRRSWTRQMRDDFLDALAATCNVRAAARAGGVPVEMVYALRRRDEGFAAEWQVALGRGYELLETLLVGQALAGGGTTLDGGDPAQPPIDVDMAMRLLTVHRERSIRAQPAIGSHTRIATRAETNAAIIAKLKTIERKLGLSPPTPAACGLVVENGRVRER